MSNSLISIIIPIYNVQQYLPNCLDSVLAQTYKNLEIILVDDGSQDNSGKICDEYAKKDNRIKVIHQENYGVAIARNMGLSIANGEWIGFLDSDDWIEQDMFQYLLNLTLKYNADIVQCGIFFEEKQKIKKIYCSQNEYFINYNIHKFTDDDFKLLSNSTCNKLYNANMIKNIKYDATYPLGEDLLFNLYAMQKAKGIVCGMIPKYHYSHREDSVCHKPPTLQELQSYHMVLDIAISLFEIGSHARRYFKIEQFKNDTDMSSKIVRFYKKEFDPCKKDIQKRLRSQTKELLIARELTIGERIKLILIAWFWSLYKILLCVIWNFR